MELILDFIGGVLRFLFYFVLNKIKGSESLPFSSFFHQGKNTTKDIDNEGANTIIGLFFLIILLVAIYLFSS